MSVKLRAACNSCHASKVRCSGEKSGCARCRTLGLECVYVESRVGKVKRRRANIQPKGLVSPPSILSASHSASSCPSPSTMTNSGEFNLHHHMWNYHAFNHQPMATATSSKLGPQENHAGLDSGMNEFDDFSDLSSLINLPPFVGSAHLANNGGSHHQTQSMDTSGVNMANEPKECACNLLEDVFSASGHDGFSLAPPSPQRLIHDEQPDEQPDHTCDATCRYSEPPEPQLTLPERSIEKDETCLTACTKVLQLLDDKVKEGLCAVDEVLHVNKQAMAKLNLVISHEEYNTTSACPLVALAAAQHVASLFKAACTDLQRSQSAQEVVRPVPSSSSSEAGTPRSQSGSPFMPTIGFGCFSPDPEEQAMLRAQIVCRELQRALVIIRKLEKPVQTPSSSDWHVKLLGNHLSDVVECMESMINLIKPPNTEEMEET
ncbi:hypothetical protein BT63DRAFT_217410 [Microthyrium microscopicum]|uniref:Zn(2)-C6 fungal-type domain-containing protein n=1 Tax=Microthyrium microscopicum TaxID=703497 RepID=A0A6A6UIS5_9PEZI|nr:hypothetical protein BT63DRAFT_217410 [Microthyrium microscopicum]